MLHIMLLTLIRDADPEVDESDAAPHFKKLRGATNETTSTAAAGSVSDGADGSAGAADENEQEAARKAGSVEKDLSVGSDELIAFCEERQAGRDTYRYFYQEDKKLGGINYNWAIGQHNGRDFVQVGDLDTLAEDVTWLLH